MEHPKKSCRQCGAEKDLSEFYLSARGRPTSPCKTCHATSVRAWQRAHPDSILVANRTWRKKNLAAKCSLALAFQKRYPGKANARNSKYRAAKRGAKSAWGNEFFVKEIYHLAQLRTKLLRTKWHVDHIVPLTSRLVCGLHVESNLRIVPAIVNHAKGNRAWPDMP